jgi:hypothetical protein
VSVKGPHGPVSRSSTMPSRTLVRNSLLFGLGVMLLELAHEAPLRSLQRDADAGSIIYQIATYIGAFPFSRYRMLGMPSSKKEMYERFGDMRM